MAFQICVALTTEGTTDVRFLENIISSAFYQIASNHVKRDIDCYVNVIDVDKRNKSFTEYVKDAAKTAMSELGANVVAVHTDADRMTYYERRDNKIVPAEKELLAMSPDEYCLLLLPIIPVRMIEAWMLADKELFRRQLGTSLTDAQLGIDGDVEEMASPKRAIEQAIRTAKEHSARKNKAGEITIGELYGITGQLLTIEQLERLSSFRNFEEEVIMVLKKLGLPID